MLLEPLDSLSGIKIGRISFLFRQRFLVAENICRIQVVRYLKCIVAVVIVKALVRRLRFGFAAEVGVEVPLADMGGSVTGVALNFGERHFVIA